MKNKALYIVLFTFLCSGLFAQPATGDYRSKTDGLWDTLVDGSDVYPGAEWEWFQNGDWVDAPTSPSGINLTLTDLVPINFTVTINHNIEILWPTPELIEGGKIVIAPNAVLLDGPYPLINSDASRIVIQANTTEVGQFINNGPIDVSKEIYLSPNAWHLVGSPVDGIDAFTAFDGFYMQEYNEDNNGWIWNDSIDNDIPVFNPIMSLGYGYSAWISSGATVTVSGSLTASDVTVILTDRSGGAIGDPNQGFNLLSNPYSSGLRYTTDWGLGNAHDAIYIWDQTVAGGSYITYNSGNLHIIGTGEGFFMQAYNNGSVLMAASNRTVTSHANPTKSTAVEEIKRARLLVQNTYNNYGDELQFEFSENASLIYNVETDASKMFGSSVSPDLFMLTEDDIPVAVAIKGLDINENSTLRMQLRPNVDATYRITAKEFTFDPSTEVLLEDLFTSDGPMTVDASLDYTFTSLANDDESRFVIYVRPAVTGIDTPDAETQFTVFGSKDQLRILTSESNYKLSVYNLLGQKLVEKINLNGNASIDLSAFNQTIVLVSIQNENELISKKIQLK